MDKNEIRLRAFNFLASYNPKIKTKFKNICLKTGQYNVPDELFQKRTPRKNRVLISWKNVKKNHLNIEQLNTFSGGVAVEFINEDYFLEENQLDPTFIELKNRLGSDDIVSSIISIRSESGNSSSAIQRQYFNKLINNTRVTYKNKEIVINKNNYNNYAINKTESCGIGNDKWTGFLFVSIKGGQQDTVQSHTSNQTIFNPACEFANQSVCIDIDLVMSYFALNSVEISNLENCKKKEYTQLITDIKKALESSRYANDTFTGNLLQYCTNHPSMRLVPGKLYDVIQVKEINIEDFGIDNKENPRSLDFTHDEAVFYERYYWDKEKKCILSPARPTNIFWSKHLSNMMQQNFSLNDYFKHEEKIINRRKKMLNNLIV